MEAITKLIWLDSMAKVFYDEEPVESIEGECPSFFVNEVFSVQLGIKSTDESDNDQAEIEIGGLLAPFTRLREVVSVPVRYAGKARHTGEYLRKAPGLFPDLLKDIKDGKLRLISGYWQALHFTFDLRNAGKTKLNFGKNNLIVTIKTEGNEYKKEIELEVLRGELPRLSIYHTEWFHADCLADYYGVESLSERHWEIMANFIRHYGKSGMNTILVPTFTPPLDTEVGGERTTVQLVEVHKNGSSYSFIFDKVKRFIDICLESGIEYFEMAHLFTQWGANAAPKVMAYTEGELKKIFGWETDSEGEEYTHFLSFYLPALIKKLDEWGLNGKVFFHLSDEPDENCIEKYSRLRKRIAPFLGDYPILDAVSRYSFVERGIVDRPVPGNNHLEPFLENKVKGLWTYYCCAQGDKVPNRFMSMPSVRNRIMGVLIYYFDIKGFLHWGYNFYNSQYSIEHINPYAVTDAGGAFQAGDAFLVYPGRDGKPEDSLRMMALNEGFQDYRALVKYEEKVGREEVISLIERLFGGKLSMENYPASYKYIEDLRKTINQNFPL
jgi:hypothetical protein